MDTDQPALPPSFELLPLAQRYAENLWTKAPKTPPPFTLVFGADDLVRVVDPDTNAVVAAAARAQVSATPEKHKYGGGEEAWVTEPILNVVVPGLPPLRIRSGPVKGPMKGSGGPYRYSWRDVSSGADQPTHVVTEAQWLALAVHFGLGDRAVDDVASGKIARRTRYRTAVALAGLVAFVVLLLVSAYLKHGGT